MTLAEQQQYKSIITEMLRDETVEVELYRSVVETSEEGEDASKRTFVPADGKTVVVKIKGGANNVRIDRVTTEDDEAFVKKATDARRQKTKGR